MKTSGLGESAWIAFRLRILCSGCVCGRGRAGGVSGGRCGAKGRPSLHPTTGSGPRNPPWQDCSRTRSEQAAQVTPPTANRCMPVATLGKREGGHRMFRTRPTHYPPIRNARALRVRPNPRLPPVGNAGLTALPKVRVHKGNVAPGRWLCATPCCDGGPASPDRRNRGLRRNKIPDRHARIWTSDCRPWWDRRWQKLRGDMAIRGGCRTILGGGLIGRMCRDLVFFASR